MYNIFKKQSQTENSLSRVCYNPAFVKETHKAADVSNYELFVQTWALLSYSRTNIRMVSIRTCLAAARLITLQETKLWLVVRRPEAEAENTTEPEHMGNM